MAVAVGQAGGLEVVAAALASALESRGAVPTVVADTDEGPTAAAANASTARCLVVLRLDPGAKAATGLYFASDRSESPAGRRLAESLAAAAARALDLEPATRGMTLPVLRESRMPATVLEVGPLDQVLERANQLAEVTTQALEGWASPEG
jgi:N-acetylmuramoyl-L-alanine amidase